MENRKEVLKIITNVIIVIVEKKNYDKISLILGGTGGVDFQIFLIIFFKN